MKKWKLPKNRSTQLMEKHADNNAENQYEMKVNKRMSMAVL
jgi:hypothetical protein